MSVRTSGTVGYGGHDLDSLTFEPATYISNGASDRIVAGNGPNELYGNKGNDKLLGQGGNDLLVGGAGRDVLYGGKGADYFVFDQSLRATNADRVMDFNRRQGDKIVLSHKYFKDIGLKASSIKDDLRLDLKVGHLSSSQFRLGATAQDETDRIVYNKKTGALHYDPDGSGAAAPVTIATFKAKTVLAAVDFLFY